MKCKTLCLFCLLFSAMYAYGQVPTRSQLLRLFYEANTAKNSGNDSIAILNYQKIIEIAPMLCEPYLYIAQIYERRANEERYLNGAIVMYRKYIDLQLDDEKTLAVSPKLKALELKAKAPHYDEYMSKAEKQKTEADSIPTMKKEEIAAVPVAKQTSIVKEKAPVVKEEDSTPQKGSADKPIVMVEPVLRVDIEANPLMTKERAYQNVKFTPEYLVGRWVSASRLNDGREAWILDISIVQNQLRVVINPASGVLSLPKWEAGMIFERSTLLDIASSSNVITSRDDLTLQLMQMLNYLQSKVASGSIENGKVNFNYKVDLQYTPSPEKRAGWRGLINGLTSVLPSELQPLSDIANHAVNVAEANDTQLSYLADINFQLELQQTGLRGTCRELLVERSQKGEHEKKNRVFNCEFYKVDSRYAGYTPRSRIKSKEQLKSENNFVKSVSKQAKNNLDAQYCLGILDAYNVGDQSKTDYAGNSLLAGIAGNISFALPFALSTNKVMLSSKLLNSLIRVAKKGHKEAIKDVTRLYYELSIDNSLSKNKRKKFLQNAEEWNEKLKAVDKAAAHNIHADYYMQSNYEIDKAIDNYLLAAKLNDSYALTKLGVIAYNENRDADKAVDYLIKAVQFGSTDAMLNIARFYGNGIGVRPNPVEYIKWVKRAIEGGNIGAIEELAYACFNGVGVDQNYQKGMKYIGLQQEQQENLWKVIVSKYGFKF